MNSSSSIVPLPSMSASCMSACFHHYINLFKNCIRFMFIFIISPIHVCFLLERMHVPVCMHARTCACTPPPPARQPSCGACSGTTAAGGGSLAWQATCGARRASSQQLRLRPVQRPLTLASHARARQKWCAQGGLQIQESQSGAHGRRRCSRRCALSAHSPQSIHGRGHQAETLRTAAVRY